MPMAARTVTNTDLRVTRALERVRRMARGMARSVPRSVQLEDLVAAGNLGLASALARFTGDPETFDAFAMTHARGAMLDELRRLDTMSRAGRRQVRRAAGVARTLASRLGRAADETEVAAELGMDLAEYRGIVLQSSTTLVDAAAIDRLDDGAAPVDEQLDARRAQRRLSAEVARLPKRHAVVISLSFEQDQTLQSIASALGVSVARAHQIRSAALEKLRRSCGGEALDAVA
jgi:RNA polymerase sigma factor for flagellar operon FliA